MRERDEWLDIDERDLDADPMTPDANTDPDPAKPGLPREGDNDDALTRHAVRDPNTGWRGLFAIGTVPMIAVVLLGIVQAALFIAMTLLLRQIIVDLAPFSVGAVATAQYLRALQLAGWLAVGGMLIGAARGLEFAVSERAGYHVVRRVRMVMYAHLQRMMPGQLRGRARGGLLLRLTGDLSMLRMWLSRGVLIGTSSAIVLTSGVALAIWLNPAMGCTLVAMCCVGAAVSLSYGHAMRRATRVMRRRRSLVIGNIDEQLNSLEVVQMAGRARGEYARLSRQNDALTAALVRMSNLRGLLRGLALCFGILATAAVIAVGIVQVYEGFTTIDTIIVVALVSRFLVRPLRALGLSHDYWHRGRVSRQKVEEFLDSSARPVDCDDLPRLAVRRGDLVLDDVHVPGQLHGFSGRASRGEIVALVGPPGSGAETVLQLVARLVDAERGSVRVDDQDLQATAPWSAGTKVGYYRADLPLLRGTVARNLTYAMPGAEPVEVQRIIRSLGLDRLIARLGMDGVQAWLTEGGRNIGQHDRQLVAFARAFMGNPRIMLLDQPLESLHPDDRDAARSLIIRHPGTVLWHTNDPEDLITADQIWFIDDGRVVATSTGGRYAQERWEQHRRQTWRADVG